MGAYSSWDSDVMLTKKQEFEKTKEQLFTLLEKADALTKKHSEANKGDYATKFTEVSETAQVEHTKIGDATGGLVDALNKALIEISSVDKELAGKITMNSKA